MRQPSPDKLKALELALAQIEKQFGEGSIMKLGAESRHDIQVLSTGSVSLDTALGVGGLPRGRIIEVFGPEASGKTTLALSTIAQTQRQGGVAAFIDAEHAFDATYAKKIGVNLDELLISQPDTGEQALEIADMLVRSNAVDVIVVDSVAALVPRAEIEGEMGDSFVGLQARLMSQAMRKLTGGISRSKTAIIFINQLREKIGVMYGCLNYASRVTLGRGESQKIGKIVNQRMPVKVLSYDPTTKRVEPRPIRQWFRNGVADEFLQLTVYYPGKNGRAQVSCTPDHPVLSPRGWRRAKRLRPGDLVMVAIPRRLGDFQLEIIRGSLLGDGCLSSNRRRRFSQGVRFRMCHGPAQERYARWKAGLFKNLPVSIARHVKGGVEVDLTPLPELAGLRREVYGEDGKKRLSRAFLHALTPLSLAIWYMDDGSFQIRNKARSAGRSDFCVEALSPESREALVQHLRKRWGLEAGLTSRGKERKAYIVFPKRATDALHRLIARYIHPSMEYKLLPQYQGRFNVRPRFEAPEYRAVPMPVLSVRRKPKTRSMHRFDIEVDGTHNFVANGVIVHNSPETTPGGRALKFYASVRLDIRRIEHLKQGDKVVGARVRVRVVKNKVAPPFRQAEFDILHDEGISRIGDLIEVGTQVGLLQKSGTWLAYGEVKLGQGKDSAKQFIRENPSLLSELESKLREKIVSS
ncbi:MAG: recombinase RecA [Candidatus Omnitrophica bacterium]|nr:recombinase RecA [Candidatus Omnitrophota bacterium]